MPVRAQPLSGRIQGKTRRFITVAVKKLAALRETAQSPRETFPWENKTAGTLRTAQHSRNLHDVKATWLVFMRALRQPLVSSSFHPGVLGVSYRLGGLLFPSQH